MTGSDVEHALPPFHKMTRKALYTIRKGVKIGESDLEIDRFFSNVYIDQDRLKTYSEFFGFKSFPMSYLYILAQRAQLALMLDKEFTLGLPGMIHLTNDLRIENSLDPSLPFNIQVRCKVPTKPYGSLLPKLEVDYFQKDKLVATCHSGYLAKRKKPRDPNAKQTKRPEPPQIDIEAVDSILEDRWILDKSEGKKYAKVSGDNNPIHKSKLFARLVGLKHPIIHGWYSVSRVLQSIESLLEVSQVTVSFMQPIFLPGSTNLKVSAGDNGFDYYVYSSSDHIHLTGKIAS